MRNNFFYQILISKILILNFDNSEDYTSIRIDIASKAKSNSEIFGAKKRYYFLNNWWNKKNKIKKSVWIDKIPSWLIIVGKDFPKFLGYKNNNYIFFKNLI